MFRRRDHLPVGRRLLNVLWPRSGWIRAWTYLAHRVSRLPGSPYSIAAGFACGVAISFTPFLGFHFLLAALGAWLLGGNLLASAIGTVAGNPWTFPLIWLTTYKIGKYLLGLRDPASLPAQLSMAYIWEHPGAVMLPMTIGGLILGAAVWAISFWLVHRLIDRYRLLRRARLRRLARRRAKRGYAREGIGEK
ncbi:MAG: DUF2062 domain-containing protein [Alphaproteobacteria bacterium]|jgi:hypothetical protein|nr:DUF2062 domain-containing protein [Alphaproteobacteria bacterium]|tara:strand:- start:162 stop:737 length:576 start_codon:yes stop_codon:yes gene_type:complete